jgi:hypothetical protein
MSGPLRLTLVILGIVAAIYFNQPECPTSCTTNFWHWWPVKDHDQDSKFVGFCW